MTTQVETHIRLDSHSVSPSDQSPRCPHEESLGPYLTYLSRNFTKFFREMSRSFCANFRGVFQQNFAQKTLGEISDFHFSPGKNTFRAKGVPRRNAKKEFFCWTDLYIQLIPFSIDYHVGKPFKDKLKRKKLTWQYPKINF